MADVTIDQQFIEYIVKALVSNPDEVVIERTIDERGVLLQLKVAPGDLGRVIGRNGTTAKSIRTLLRALGVKNDARYNLKIVDTNEGGENGERRTRRDDEGQKTYGDEDLTQPATGEESSAEADEITHTAEETGEVNTEAEDQAEEEDSLARHRKDLDDLTLDI